MFGVGPAHLAVQYGRTRGHTSGQNTAVQAGKIRQCHMVTAVYTFGFRPTHLLLDLHNGRPKCMFGIIFAHLASQYGRTRGQPSGRIRQYQRAEYGSNSGQNTAVPHAHSCVHIWRQIHNFFIRFAQLTSHLHVWRQTRTWFVRIRPY